jgi:hypothetical protein
MTGGGPSIPHGSISASWRTGLLVDAEHDGLLRRVHIQPDHVADLGVELGIGGELERLGTPGLQVPLAPDPGTDANPICNCSPSNRADQCVTPRAVASSAATRKDQ